MEVTEEDVEPTSESDLALALELDETPSAQEYAEGQLDE